MFLTGPQLLPKQREHRGRTLPLIDGAEAAGHTRGAQMNKQVLTNLDRMIGEIEARSRSMQTEQPMRADNSQHVVTAARRRAEHTRRPALAALRRMDTTGMPATFDAVARESGPPSGGTGLSGLGRSPSDHRQR